jgi:outer membrane protein OmpA-like peptidoglycan-associated protein
MPDRKSSSTSNSSRTVAKVAVAVLIVIAIGGFVLAGLKSGKSAPEQAVAADSTQEPAVAPTTGAAPAAAAAAASAEATELPSHIVAFAPSAANLSEKELAKVRTMAETAKKKNRAIEIVSTVEESQFGLAQQRVSLVRQTLVDNGVPLTRMSTQVSKVAHGAATEANFVAMNLK